MHPTKPTLDDLRIERTTRPASPTRMWPVLLGLAIVAVGAVVVWWLMRPKPLEVRTTLVREISTSQNTERTVLNASGYVTARRAATVSSKITGKVVEVLIEEGLKVKTGQVLARLDDTNVKASLRLAEAQLESATNALAETRIRIQEAEQELQRQRDLVKSLIATQADFDHADASARALKAWLDQQQSEVRVAERQVAAWHQQLDDTIIRAPFDGIVTSKNAQPGEMISPMSVGGFTRTGICTIVDMESLEVEIDVSESYINRVEPGQAVEATLDAYSDWKMACKVIAIIPTADRQKSTVKVRVAFDKLDRRILPEMAVKVNFRESVVATPGAGRTLVIPKSAVENVDGRDVVFVAQKGRAERRAVTVRNRSQDEVVISAGLESGEKVIVDHPPGLVNGATVLEKR